MDRIIPGVIVAVVLAALLTLMWRSWRRRSARDSGLAAGHPLPAEVSPELAREDVLYVATTPRQLPLERLAVRGLAFRARGELLVTEDGLVLNLDGEDALFIPAAAVDVLEDATWTIDRAVEPGGLVLIGWTLPRPDHHDAGQNGNPTQVDSYFRITDPAGRERILGAIRSVAPHTTAPHTNVSDSIVLEEPGTNASQPSSIAPEAPGPDARTESEV